MCMRVLSLSFFFFFFFFFSKIVTFTASFYFSPSAFFSPVYRPHCRFSDLASGLRNRPRNWGKGFPVDKKCLELPLLRNRKWRMRARRQKQCIPRYHVLNCAKPLHGIGQKQTGSLQPTKTAMLPPARLSRLFQTSLGGEVTALLRINRSESRTEVTQGRVLLHTLKDQSLCSRHLALVSILSGA